MKENNLERRNESNLAPHSKAKGTRPPRNEDQKERYNQNRRVKAAKDKAFEESKKDYERLQQNIRNSRTRARKRGDADAVAELTKKLEANKTNRQHLIAEGARAILLRKMNTPNNQSTIGAWSPACVLVQPSPQQTPPSQQIPLTLEDKLSAQSAKLGRNLTDKEELRIEREHRIEQQNAHVLHINAVTSNERMKVGRFMQENHNSMQDRWMHIHNETRIQGGEAMRAIASISASIPIGSTLEQSPPPRAENTAICLDQELERMEEKENLPGTMNSSMLYRKAPETPRMALAVASTPVSSRKRAPRSNHKLPPRPLSYKKLKASQSKQEFKVEPNFVMKVNENDIGKNMRIMSPAGVTIMGTQWQMNLESHVAQIKEDHTEGRNLYLIGYATEEGTPFVVVYAAKPDSSAPSTFMVRTGGQWDKVGISDLPVPVEWVEKFTIPTTEEKVFMLEQSNKTVRALAMKPDLIEGCLYVSQDVHALASPTIQVEALTLDGVAYPFTEALWSGTCRELFDEFQFTYEQWKHFCEWGPQDKAKFLSIVRGKALLAFADHYSKSHSFLQQHNAAIGDWLGEALWVCKLKCEEQEAASAMKLYKIPLADA